MPMKIEIDTFRFIVLILAVVGSLVGTFLAFLMWGTSELTEAQRHSHNQFVGIRQDMVKYQMEIRQDLAQYQAENQREFNRLYRAFVTNEADLKVVKAAVERHGQDEARHGGKAQDSAEGGE